MGICGGVAEMGGEFCMSSEEEWITRYHVRTSRAGEELLGGKEGEWVVMYPLNPRLLPPSLFQPIMDLETASKAPVFQGFPTEWYTLSRWAIIFQVL